MVFSLFERELRRAMGADIGRIIWVPRRHFESFGCQLNRRRHAIIIVVREYRCLGIILVFVLIFVFIVCE
jgi:hypothetical protein